MIINVFPIVSNLHQENRINGETKNLLDALKKALDCQINITNVSELYNADLSLILIQSGGSEQAFIKNLVHLKAPFYLLTYGTNNSLAASLEILSYLRDNSLEGEVLHGDLDYLVKRIKTLTHKLERKKLGVIGKPSDWLIASQVDYNKALKYYNLELIDIPMHEVIDLYQKVSASNILPDLKFNSTLKDSKRLFQTLELIKEKYELSGLTIRCFDLLDTIKTTACLSLAYFNSQGITSSCEGDIPSLISMELLKQITAASSFQANPSRIDITNKTMVFAHCTLPLNMTTSYTLDTHFESGIGVAIRGKLKEEKITIFKLSRDLKNYFVTTGRILKNLEEPNLCRTQILVKVDDNINYFLTRPYGNHHIIVYGDYKKEIEEFMKQINFA